MSADAPPVGLFGGAYAGRRVLVTGHTGFLGAWTARWLVQLGAQVAGYSRRPHPAEPVLPAGIQTYLGDVTDQPRLAAALAEFAPEIVLHLAGGTVVAAGFRAPGQMYTVNVLGTISVLEAVLSQPSVRSVVVMSTPAVPPVGDDLALSPYPASKLAVEAVVAGYGHAGTRRAADRAGHIEFGVARPGVMIGGDWGEGRLLADAARSIEAGEPVVLRAPFAVRPWQHALDGISGALMLAARLHREGAADDPDRPGGPGEHSRSRALAEVSTPPATPGGTLRRRYEFGRLAPQHTEPVIEVVEGFLAAYGLPDWPVKVAGDGADDRLELGCAAATVELGWRPVWALPAALRATARWYRAAGADPGTLPAVMDEAIDEYARTAATTWQ